MLNWIVERRKKKEDFHCAKIYQKLIHVPVKYLLFFPFLFFFLIQLYSSFQHSTTRCFVYVLIILL